MISRLYEKACVIIITTNLVFSECPTSNDPRNRKVRPIGRQLKTSDIKKRNHHPDVLTFLSIIRPHHDAKPSAANSALTRDTNAR